MGGMVTIFDPQGNPGEIPQDQLQAAVRAGAIPAVHMKSPDGSDGYVPATRTQEAIRAGATILPIEQQEVQHPGFWSTLGSDLWGMAKPLITPPTSKDELAQRAQMLRGALFGKDPQELIQGVIDRANAGYGPVYSALAPTAEQLGVNVKGMEQSAAEGDVGGVAGHAAAVPVAMAATEALRVPGIVKKAVAGKPGIYPGAPLPEAPTPALVQAQSLLNGPQPVVDPAAGLGKIPLNRLDTPATPAPAPVEAAAAPKTVPLKKLDSLIDESLGVKKPVPGVRLKDQIAAQSAAQNLPEGFTATPKSSNLRGYKYNPATEELDAITNTGQRYRHAGVTQDQFDAFESADSKGAAWNKLRDGPGVTPLGKVNEAGELQPRIKPHSQTFGPETDLAEQIKDSAEPSKQPQFKTLSDLDQTIKKSAPKKSAATPAAPAGDLLSQLNEMKARVKGGAKLSDLNASAATDKYPVKIVYDEDGNMADLDGRHRVMQAIEEGKKTISVEVTGRDGSVSTAEVDPKVVAKKFGVTKESLAATDAQQPYRAKLKGKPRKMVTQ